VIPQADDFAFIHKRMQELAEDRLRADHDTVERAEKTAEEAAAAQRFVCACGKPLKQCLCLTGGSPRRRSIGENPSSYPTCARNDVPPRNPARAAPWNPT
jgi:hypothetical protein